MVQTDCHLGGCWCSSQRTWGCSLSSLHAMFIMVMSPRTVLAYILQYPKCSEAQSAPGGKSHGHKLKKSQKHEENLAFPIIYLVNKLAAIAGRQKDNVKGVYKKTTEVKRGLLKVHL